MWMIPPGYIVADYYAENEVEILIELPALGVVSPVGKLMIIVAFSYRSCEIVKVIVIYVKCCTL